MNHGPETDGLHELLTAVGTGDRRAFDALWSRLSGRLHAIALRMLGDADLAEDAVHDTFVQIWRNAGRYDRARGGVAVWMIGILRCRAVDLLRRRGRESLTAPVIVADPADQVAADREGRPAPMALTLDPVTPPARLKARIDASLAGDTSLTEATQMIDLRRALTLWRWTAAAAGLAAVAAAAMAAFLLIRQPLPDPDATRLVAVLRPVEAAEAPTWVVSAEPGEGFGRKRLLVRTLGVPAAGTASGARDFELWVVPGEGATPVSLGLVDPARETRVDLPAALGSRLGNGLGLAVSIEPVGGSPSGAPTGPVVLIGALTRTGG